MISSETLRRLVRSLSHLAMRAALLTMLALTAAPNAHAGVVDDAQDIVGQLNPINLALGPLIDRAISKGDAALAKRLTQLQEIVQQALATADAIAARRIADVDERAARRLGQLRTIVDDSMRQFQDLADGRIAATDIAVGARITQLQREVGGLVEAINWLNVDPVLNVGATGIAIYKQEGPFTTVFISGVGLRKENQQPKVWLVSRGKELPLKVETASAAGMTVLVPNSELPKSGTSTFIMKAKLSRGYHLPSLVWLPNSINARSPMESTFPLTVGVLGSYSVDVTLTGTGQRWERSSSATTSAGAQPYMNCNKGAKPSGMEISASAPEGWEIDYSRSITGLSYSCGGEGEHSCTDLPRRVVIWCSSEHRDRGGHVRMSNASSYTRRKVNEPVCGQSTATAKLIYSDTTQVRLDKDAALKTCLESGLDASPTLVAKVVVHRPYGMGDFERTLRVNVPEVLPGDPVRMLLTPEGTVEITLTPSFKWSHPTASILKSGVK